MPKKIEGYIHKDEPIQRTVVCLECGGSAMSNDCENCEHGPHGMPECCEGDKQLQCPVCPHCTDGKVTETAVRVEDVVDESKLPLFSFDCGRHTPWQERKHLGQGSSYCKECSKEHKEYNDMLVEKGFNWPQAIPRATKGTLLNEGGKHTSIKVTPVTVATLGDLVEWRLTSEME